MSREHAEECVGYWCANAGSGSIERSAAPKSGRGHEGTNGAGAVLNDTYSLYNSCG